MKNEFVIEKEWKRELTKFLETETCTTLTNFVQEEYKSKKIYPMQQDIFRAFTLTPFSKVKVVILGQDPYHNDGQAHGLSFSVPDGVTPQPSLKNIYKELESDCGVTKDFTSGNLDNWGRQGVFLLNAILTVVAHTPVSHQKKGWEKFTDTVIRTISDKHEHVVFILWGNYARSKRVLIDTSKHYVLEAPHPSPFSAYTGFFGCKHFSKCNEYLEKHGKEGVRW